MNLVTKYWNWSFDGPKRVVWLDETRIYCIGSDSNKGVWKKPQKNFKIYFYSEPSSLEEYYWWYESVSQISLSPWWMEFREMGVPLISETIISTQTAVSAPSDPISEWNSRGHRGKSFLDDYQRSWRALKNAWSESFWQYTLKTWVKGGIVHTDSPVLRKERILVEVSEEVMVEKKEALFSHVCTWNWFIQY